MVLGPHRFAPWKIWAAAGALLLLGAALAVPNVVDEAAAWTRPIDVWWQSAIGQIRRSEPAIVDWAVDWAGYTGMFVYHGLLLVMLLFSRQYAAALFTALAALVTVPLTETINALWGGERPQPQLIPSDGGAFPSGHSATTTAAMLATALVIGRMWIWILGGIVTVLSMIHRTYLNVHWLSDVVGGFALGAFVVLALWVLFQDRCAADSHRSPGRGPLKPHP